MLQCIATAGTVAGTSAPLVRNNNNANTDVCMCPCNACKENRTVRNNNNNNNNNNNIIINHIVMPSLTAKEKQKGTATVSNNNNDNPMTKTTKKSNAVVMVDAIVSHSSDRKYFIGLTHSYRKIKCKQFKFQMFAMCMSFIKKDKN